MLNRFIQSQFVNLLSGLILLLTSGYETWISIEEFNIGAHHGVLVFSLVQIMKSLPEILQSVKELNVAVKPT